MAKILFKVPQIFEIINKLLCHISGILYIVIVALLGSSILGRFLFNKPILGAVEICEVLFVFALFLALAYTQSRGRHIRVTFIYRHFPLKLRSIMHILVHALSAIFFSLLAWQTGLGAWKSLMISEASTGALTFPIYPAKFAIPFGCTLIAFQFVRDIFTDLEKKEAGKEG